METLTLLGTSTGCHSWQPAASLATCLESRQAEARGRWQLTVELSSGLPTHTPRQTLQRMDNKQLHLPTLMTQNNRERGCAVTGPYLRWRQENQKVKAILSHLVSLRPAWAIRQSVSKTKEMQNHRASSQCYQEGQ